MNSSDILAGNTLCAGEARFMLRQPAGLNPGVLFSICDSRGEVIRHVSIGEDRRLRASRKQGNRWATIHTYPIEKPGEYDISYFYGSPSEYFTVDGGTATFSMALSEPLDDRPALIMGYPGKPDLSVADGTVGSLKMLERPSARRKLGDCRVLAIITAKNEEELLPQCLDQLGRLCDGVVVLDDGSSDSTPEILCNHPAVVKFIRKDSALWHDGGNKLQLVYEAQEFEPEWLLNFDADDLFEEKAYSLFQGLLESPEEVKVYRFQYFHLWDSRTHYRCDAPYNRQIWVRKLWRNEVCDFIPVNKRVHSVVYGAHWSPVNIHTSDLRIKHFGNYTMERRLRRYQMYQREDSSLAGQVQGYEHLLQSGAEVQLARFDE